MTLRWKPARHNADGTLIRGAEVENDKIDAFLNDIVEVCKKHGLWLSHEDGHGAFEVVSDDTSTWLLDAQDCTKEEP